MSVSHSMQHYVLVQQDAELGHVIHEVRHSAVLLIGLARELARNAGSNKAMYKESVAEPPDIFTARYSEAGCFKVVSAPIRQALGTCGLENVPRTTVKAAQWLLDQLSAMIGIGGPWELATIWTERDLISRLVPGDIYLREIPCSSMFLSLRLQLTPEALALWELGRDDYATITSTLKDEQ